MNEVNSYTLEQTQEFLVLLEFSDANEASYCKQFNNEFESIDIESSNPIVKIGNRLYSGQYQNNIGTYLLFSEQASSSPAPNKYDIAGKTYKKLILTRLYIKSKEGEEESKE